MQNHQSKFILPDSLYFSAHSLGPHVSDSPRSKKFFDSWKEVAGDQVWTKWLNFMEDFRELVAFWTQTQSKFICPQPSASMALSQIIHSLPSPHPSRNKILFHQKDFPTIGYVISRAQRLGYAAYMIPESEPIHAPETWRKWITEEVSLCHMTHVTSHTSEQLNIKEINEICHRKGVLSVCDLAQSLIIKKVALEDWKIDFAIGSTIKWGCGGPGAGFLYCSEPMLKLCDPSIVGWFSHANPFEHDITNFEFAKDALKFLGGTPSILPMAIASDSLSTLKKIGSQEIRDHNQELLGQMIEISESHHITVISPKLEDFRGGTLILNLPQLSLASAVAEKIEINQTPKGHWRISPHIYNSITEVETLFSMIKKYT